VIILVEIKHLSFSREAAEMTINTDTLLQLFCVVLSSTAQGW
jgi:hypothetical protein